jgi:hypothetical protein
MSYYVENEPVRKAVILACREGHVSLSSLAGELGYKRVGTTLLRRQLGISTYIERYNGEARRVVGIKPETARIIYNIVAPENEREADWLVPVEGWFNSRKGRGASLVWANGKPLVYSWRLRILVENAVAEGRITLAEIARKLGYIKNDSAPLRRALGLKPHHGVYQCLMDADNALFLCYRLGYDPVDWGI